MRRMGRAPRPHAMTPASINAGRECSLMREHCASDQIALPAAARRTDAPTPVPPAMLVDPLLQINRRVAVHARGRDDLLIILIGNHRRGTISLLRRRWRIAGVRPVHGRRVAVAWRRRIHGSRRWTVTGGRR